MGNHRAEQIQSADLVNSPMTRSSYGKVLFIRIDDRMKELAREQAKQRGQTLSEWVRAIIANALAQKDS